MHLYINIGIILFGIYAMAVISAVIVNYINKNNGLKGIPYTQCFSPIKLVSVLLGFILFTIIPEHILEQYIIRFYDEDCRAECINGNGGKCVSCGCHTRAKMWSPLERCSKTRWQEIIWSKRKYIELRKEYPLQIKIKYGPI